MSQDLATSLGQAPLFVGLPQSLLSKFAAEGIPRIFRAREVLYAESNGGFCFFIQFGRVRIHKPTPMGEMFLVLARPGEMPGLEQLYSVSPRVTALALDACSVVAFPIPAAQALFADCPELGGRLAERTHAIAVDFMERMTDLACFSVQERLLRFLLQQAKKYGIQSNNGGVLVDIGLSHLDLAASVGTSRETVTTVLNGLKQDGLLDIGRKTITLIDIDRLRALAQYH